MAVTFTADHILTNKERFNLPAGLCVKGTIVVTDGQITLRGNQSDEDAILVDDENMRKQFCTESRQREYPEALVLGQLEKNNGQLILTAVREVHWRDHGQQYSRDFEAESLNRPV